MSPIKIGILGDTHCLTNWATEAVRMIHDHGVQHIIQVGDFGLLTHKYTGILYLDELNKVLSQKNVFMTFLRGNHENHDHLDNIPLTSMQSANGGWFVRSHIIWSPDGNYWTWDNKRFMTVGGAVSIDKDRRLHEERKTGVKTWWPQEQLGDAALTSIINNQVIREAKGKKGVDYLFTHDAPTCLPLTYLKPDPDSHAHRQKMNQLGKAIKPALWFHGHYHARVEYDFPQYEPYTKVYGLDTHVHDGLVKGNGKDRWGILDTEDNTFQYATEVQNELRIRERINGE